MAVAHFAQLACSKPQRPYVLPPPPLFTEDDKAYVTDLNSTNGTRVDGRELSPMDNVEITVGSEIVFGARGWG